MPTMTAISLEQLLEPSAGCSAPHKAKPPCPPDHHLDRTTITTAAAPAPSTSPRPYFIFPALYATPDPAPLLDSPLASVSPSPYVVNRKGRRAPGPPARPASRLDGFEISDIPLAGNTTAVGGQKNEEASLTAKCSVESWGSASGLVGDGGDGLEKQEGDRVENLPTEEEEGKEEEEEEEEEEGKEEENDDGRDDFLDPQDSTSVTSCCSSARFGNQSHLSNQFEFYDAAEDFFSDGSVSHSSPTLSTNPEIELRALRINLLEEIGKRKVVEEALLHMQNQWNSIANHLTQVGVSFPKIQHPEDVQFQIDPAAICQEMVIAKFVSEALEKGLARAEVEAAAEAVIHSKNHEISRLRDRVQYYEAVNHEMSQRNQEIVELARQQRLRRKIRWRWLWSGIGLSITMGASLLAYSYMAHPGEGSLTTSCPDAPSGTGGSVEDEY